MTSFPNLPGNVKASKIEHWTTDLSGAQFAIVSIGRSSKTWVQDVFAFAFQPTTIPFR